MISKSLIKNLYLRHPCQPIKIHDLFLGLLDYLKTLNVGYFYRISAISLKIVSPVNLKII